MFSTFQGLETARRALTTQQAALLTTAHNVANASTPGYTRQRVNLMQTEAYPSVGMNSPQIPGQMGTGVKIGDVQRIRDAFADKQYRAENSKNAYWQARSDQLSQMENVMNEPSDTGLANTMDQFWSSLQDLASQPQSDSARRVVRQRGIALADTFNYISNSLQASQKNYRNEIDVSQQNANSILSQINELNKQIGAVEPSGSMPNDLYDERDKLVDNLSTMMNVKIETKSSGGLSSANAEGLYDVYLANPQGEILKDSHGNAIKLVDSSTSTANGIHIQYENRQELDSPVAELKFFKLTNDGSGFVNLTQSEADQSTSPVYEITDCSQLDTNGKLRGYIEGYGYKSNVNGVVTNAGLFNSMIANLDKMAYTFANQFNLVHQTGWSTNEINSGGKNPQDFFSFNGISLNAADPKGAAANLKVADGILSDVGNIAAAAEANVLSGVMVRDSVNSGTVGNPVISGIYDPTAAACIFSRFCRCEKNKTYVNIGGEWRLVVYIDRVK